ncbi:MAG: DUF6455 family protein [Hyphomonadaceae bacterium]
MNTTLSAGGRRLREMMRQQRVDVLELRYDEVGATFERARRACEHCASMDKCLAWLQSEKTERAPAFCPNRRVFERFREL